MTDLKLFTVGESRVAITIYKQSTNIKPGSYATKMVKSYTEQQIDSMIRIKWGKAVTSQFHTAHVSNALLGKLFKCSAEKIR